MRQDTQFFFCFSRGWKLPCCTTFLLSIWHHYSDTWLNCRQNSHNFTVTVSTSRHVFARKLCDVIFQFQPVFTFKISCTMYINTNKTKIRSQQHKSNLKYFCWEIWMKSATQNCFSAAQRSDKWSCKKQWRRLRLALKSSSVRHTFAVKVHFCIGQILSRNNPQHFTIKTKINLNNLTLFFGGILQYLRALAVLLLRPN